MTLPLTCGDVAERGLVERYFAGRLDHAEAQTFEAHFVACPRCQEDLRLAAAVRHNLPLVSGARPARRPWSRPLLVGVGLAAGLAALLFWPADRVDPQLAGMGQVLEPPIYLGVPVRGAPSAADSLFDAAMTAYAGRSYQEAAEGLAAALEAGVDSVPALFFRASSLLMVNRPRDAAELYERVAVLGDTPYQAESRLYRAKALLRLGRATEAVAELRLVAERQDEPGRWASALADSVEARIQR